MPEIIAPPDTRFLTELHAELDQLVLTCAEQILGRSTSIILEKPLLVSEESVGNRSSSRFAILLKAPGHESECGLLVKLDVSMWRKSK